MRLLVRSGAGGPELLAGHFLERNGMRKRILEHYFLEVDSGILLLGPRST